MKKVMDVHVLFLMKKVMDVHVLSSLDVHVL
jgi:hypothetical protein